MIRQIEEGDTKGGIIIPKDTFKGLWSFRGDVRLKMNRDEFEIVVTPEKKRK